MNTPICTYSMTGGGPPQISSSSTTTSQENEKIKALQQSFLYHLMKKLYLPKAEEDNSFDAQELCKRLMRFQLFCKDMIKYHQRIQSQ